MFHHSFLNVATAGVSEPLGTFGTSPNFFLVILKYFLTLIWWIFTNENDDHAEKENILETVCS